MNKLSVIFIFLAFFLATCEECDPNETKCEGDKVYQCYSDGRWEKILDCDHTVGPEEESVWKCEEDYLGEATCVLVNPDGGTE